VKRGEEGRRIEEKNELEKYYGLTDAIDVHSVAYLESFEKCQTVHATIFNLL